MSGVEIVTGEQYGALELLAHPIRRIETIEVMKSDLETLQERVADEQSTLGFFAAAVGAFAPFLVQTMTLPDNPTAYQVGIWSAATGLSGVAALWFGLAWRRKRGQAKRWIGEMIAARQQHVVDLTRVPRV